MELETYRRKRDFARPPIRGACAGSAPDGVTSFRSTTRDGSISTSGSSSAGSS